jgi:hypothetical protein
MSGLCWVMRAAAAFVLAIAAYRLLERKRQPLAPGRVPQETCLRRVVRLFGLSLPGLFLLVWGWSYVDRLQLPALNTFHYPAQAKGGEILIVPRFDRGHLHIRYCRVIPGEPDRSAFIDGWGFRYTVTTDHRYKAGTFVESNTYVPIWLAMLLTLPLAIPCLAWELRGRQYRHRVLHGLCIHCGYDLTGNTSGTCPECGTPAGPTGTTR